MTKFHSLLLAFAASATAAAAPLTPEQALAAALSSNARAAAPALNPASYTLAHSVADGGVYVFNNSNGGFIVASGDDTKPALLGYCDNGAYDPTDAPPSLTYLLQTMATHKISPARVGQKHDEIAPQVTSKWNQDSPYNDDCPTMSGYATYTGCMATAISQVLYHWKKPLQGTGTASYFWTNGGKTLTFDYAAHPFDWANMIDQYGGGLGTVTQRAAVANLMHGVGMACQMMYGTEGSGAYDFVSIDGMIKHLGVDPSARVALRSSYSADGWDNLIYNQLTTGHPLVYTGVSEGGGHAFVCDGYQYNNGNYYHINWGWGGAYDGYFLLSNLEPTGQGIGGGSGAYNDSQSAMIGIKPAEGGVRMPALYIFGAFLPGAQTVKRTDYASFTLQEGGAFLSYDNEDVTAAFGLKLVDANSGETTYMRVTGALDIAGVELPNFTFFEPAYNIPASAFPEGNYYVYPAFESNGTWFDMPHYDAQYRDYITLEATSDKLIFDAYYEIAQLRAFNLQAPDLVDNTVVFGPEGSADINITADITSLVDNYDGDLYLGFSGSEGVMASEPVTVSLAADQQTPFSATFTIDGLAEVEPQGALLLLQKNNKGEWQAVSGVLNVTLSSGTEPEPEPTISALYFNDELMSADETTVIPVKGSLIFKVEMLSKNAPWEGIVMLAAKDATGKEVTNRVCGTTLPADEAYTETFRLDRNDLADGEAVAVYGVLTDNSNNELMRTSDYPIMLEVENSIDTLNADDSADAAYYTLQGVRVSRPSQGVYIMVKGGKAVKVNI